MKERRERGPLPARAHVVATKIVHDVDPEPAGERRAVADLIGTPGLGLVANRVAGEAHQRDVLPAPAGFGQQRLGDIRVELGERALRGPARATPLDHRSELLA